MLQLLHDIADRTVTYVFPFILIETPQEGIAAIAAGIRAASADHDVVHRSAILDVATVQGIGERFDLGFIQAIGAIPTESRERVVVQVLNQGSQVISNHAAVLLAP